MYKENLVKVNVVPDLRLLDYLLLKRKSWSKRLEESEEEIKNIMLSSLFLLKLLDIIDR